MPQHMRRRDLIPFCRRMGTSLDAGIDIRKCWQREAERARGSQRRVMAQIAQQLEAGTSVADAMSDTGQFFPQLVRDLIHVGEVSGNSDAIFKGLAEHYARLQELRRTYLKGITWPAIQLFGALVVVGLFILVMGLIQAQNAEPTDVLGFGLVGVSGFLIYVSFLSVLAIVLSFLIRGWQQGKFGARYLMQFLMRVPYLGECIQYFALARMAWTLSLVSQTSMDVRKAVGLAAAGTNNPFFARHEQQLKDVISQGRPIHEALREAKVFPLEFVDAIEAGEMAGKLNDALDFLSREYQSRAALMSETLTKLASFGTWFIVACIVIFFILRVFMVYLNALNSVASF